jgi:hypothetical protein
MSTSDTPIDWVPPLLRLPIELRLMIYDLLLPLITPHSRWRTSPQEGVFIIARPSEDQPPGISCLGRDPRPRSSQVGILTLRAVNRQIYRETNRFIYVHPLRLRIIDGLSFRDCSKVAVLNLMKQRWISENIVYVELYFASNGLWFTYPARCASQPSPQNEARYTLSYGYCIWTWLRNRLFGHKDQSEDIPHEVNISQELRIEEPGSLTQLAEALNTFPQLKYVTLNTDSSLLFEIWSDPMQDADAFKPLLDRGVHVSFEFPPFYNTAKVVEYRAGFDAMLLRRKKLLNLRSTPNMKSKVTWKVEGNRSHIVALQDTRV